MASILVLNGPNLNLLGSREPEHYGAKTLEQINQQLLLLASDADFEINFGQSNAEHELIDIVQRAAGKVDFLIINPAAFTHTSVALRDAILGVGLPYIEVHLSNIHAREAFRKHSYFSDAAVGVICGLGAQGYELALQAAISFIQNQSGS
jgi:3-dehydroquinate dehydratase-2